MLERITVTGEETNKYFLHNNGLANEWEKFANDLNGKIEGQVNGQILEFDLDFEIAKTKIHVYQIRQISNKYTGTLADDGLLMTKNTIIKFSPITTKLNDWKIVKNSKLARHWYRLKGFSKPLDIDPKYLVISKRPIFSSDLLTQKEFNYLKKMAEIRHIIKKGSLLEIEFFTALGTDSTKKIVNMILETRR
jgi:hypothetical protein